MLVKKLIESTTSHNPSHTDATRTDDVVTNNTDDTTAPTTIDTTIDTTTIDTTIDDGSYGACVDSFVEKTGSENEETRKPSPPCSAKNDWDISWGVYCRRTATKENQDGWTIFKKFEGDKTCSVWGCWQKENEVDQEKPAECPKDSPADDTSAASRINCEHNRFSISNPWIFTVLDGHGTGGRVAAHVAAKILSSHVSEELSKIGSSVINVRDSLCEMYRTIERGFESAQDRILDCNREIGRDFGTTAILSACMGRYIVTATCGDSSSILIGVVKHTNVIVNVQLSVDHSLGSVHETNRIQEDGKGRVVLGDGSVKRLIPTFYTYEAAKMKGLSINMARALGHSILSKCGLSPLPQITLVDITDVCQTLADLNRTSTHNTIQTPTHQSNNQSKKLASNNCFGTYVSHLYEARDFKMTILQKFQCDNFDSAEFEPTSQIGEERKISDKIICNSQDELTRKETQTTTTSSSSCIIYEETPEVNTDSRPDNSRPDDSRLSNLENSGHQNSYNGKNVDHDVENVSVVVDEEISPTDNHEQKINWRSPDESPEKQNESLAMSVAPEVLQKTDFFVVLMSDGVSDVLGRQQIGELVIELSKTYCQEDSCAMISKIITERAAHIRRSKGFRADNCTCVVARLTP